MTSTRPTAPDYLELVFQDRPRDYGAYRLRRLETRHTLTGLGVGLLLIALAFLLPFSWYRIQQRQASRVPVSQERVVTLNQLSAPPPIEQPVIPPQVEPLPQASVRHLPPVVKKDEEVPDEVEMPTVQELSVALPSPVTAPGDSFVYLPPPPAEPEPEPEPAPKAAPAPKVFQVVEEMPEFPGGEQAMYAFLRKNMVYPTVARENGISGRVYVKFTVQPDGRVSNVYVARGIGGGCDEEAVRVVRMMPAWKPGIQSGRAVPVEYTLPLNFVFQD